MSNRIAPKNEKRPRESIRIPKKFSDELRNQRVARGEDEPRVNIMNTRYVVPVVFAAALHGVLLFGFPKSPRPVLPAAVEDKPIPFITVTLDPDEPDIVDVICSGPPSIMPPDALRPAGVEPVVFEAVDRMNMDIPLILPIALGDVREIVPSNLRPGDGIGEGDWRKNIIPGGALDNPPRVRFQATPIYPFEEKKNGVPGAVYVEFEVDESGVVHNPRVTKSSSRAFEEPTLRAVAKWRFEPGKRHGKVVGFRMTVPVHFSLND